MQTNKTESYEFGGAFKMKNDKNDTFTIITDSTSNLPRPYIEKYGIVVLPLTYMVEDREYPGFSEEPEENFKQLYELLRWKSNYDFNGQ